MNAQNLPPGVREAMDTLSLSLPFSQDTLKEQYDQLRRTWHPSRYAGLTNNPGKYMEMYKKGEARTKKIEAAYQVLSTYLKSYQAI